MENLKATQGVNMASSAITSAANAYTSYNRAKHNARMEKMNWRYNKAATLTNLKVNQYINARNRLEIMHASAEQRLDIQKQEMQAKADATVVQATYGMQGGSAQQVMHAISREAENAESKRLYALDNALFSNKMEMYAAASGALQQIGVQPVGKPSSALAIGGAAMEINRNFSALLGG